MRAFPHNNRKKTGLPAARVGRRMRSNRAIVRETVAGTSSRALAVHGHAATAPDEPRDPFMTVSFPDPGLGCVV